MLLGMASQRQHIVNYVRARTRHISLASDPAFQDTFVGELGFPSVN
jgi:hypothetical protein